ncbi:redoxin domain-containing protein [Paenibacillus lemnae]|uniref:TlpA family protein disulfide reductase n=1 Tax=Paenibacillus lemnae TaxID=1330551 RepID=A0A848MAF9_PAELE|nr:TlpA family protein disulfide reductase [Paenibacillus lemnae]
MQQTFSLGPLTLNLTLVLLMLSHIVGYFVLKLRLSLAHYEHRSTILNELVGHAVTAFFIWKLSLIVTETRIVMEQPMSLLYYDGGSTGLLLAAIYVLIRLWLTSRKQRIPFIVYVDAVITWLAAAYGGFTLLMYFFGQGSFVVTITVSVIVFSMLGFQLFLKKTPGTFDVSIRNGAVAVMLLGMAAWAIADYQQEKWDEAQTVYDTVPGIDIGNAAREFTLSSIDGSPVTLSDYRGQTVILNFWATWCPPCRVEMPHIEKFHQQYKDDNVVVLAINLTHTESSTADVKQFIENMEFEAPVLFDPQGKVSKDYKITAYPTTFVVNPEGVITHRYQGAVSYSILKKAYEEL